MQETRGNSSPKRVWPSLPEDVYDDLWEFAKEERRTASEMAAIFIENAIKARKRRRKNGKSEDNS